MWLWHRAASGTAQLSCCASRREGSCRALQQRLLGRAEPQIRAVCCSSAIPLLSTLRVTKWTLWNTLSQKIHLWHFLKQHCLLDIISVNLAFWLLDMPENSHFSTLFLLLLSCCIYSRWKPDVILLRELSFLKGNIHQGRSRRCSFAVNYLNFSFFFFFLLNRKSKKMYLKAIVLWLQNKSHLP